MRRYESRTELVLYKADAIRSRRAAALREGSRWLGFESLWIPEHAAIPHGYQTHYPYSPTGRLPTDDEEMPFPDPFITLAFAAGVTNQIKFGTNIAILPQRHPLYAARNWRRSTAIQRAGDSRYRLGMAQGGVRRFGHRLPHPGVRTDECIKALRTLWRDDPASFDGKLIKFGPMRSFPKPVQKGGIPIHIGGISAPAIRRTARYGDGFLPVPVEDIAGLYKQLRDECAKICRNPAEIELSCPAEATLAGVKRAQDLGAARATTGIFFSRDLEQISGTWKRSPTTFSPSCRGL